MWIVFRTFLDGVIFKTALSISFFLICRLSRFASKSSVMSDSDSEEPVSINCLEGIHNQFCKVLKNCPKYSFYHFLTLFCVFLVNWQPVKNPNLIEKRSWCQIESRFRMFQWLMFVGCKLMIIGQKVSYFAMNHYGAVWFLSAQSVKEVKPLLLDNVGFLFAWFLQKLFSLCCGIYGIRFRKEAPLN